MGILALLTLCSLGFCVGLSRNVFLFNSTISNWQKKEDSAEAGKRIRRRGYESRHQLVLQLCAAPAYPSLEITPREVKKKKKKSHESLALFDRRGGVFTKSARTKHPQTCPDLLSWDNITVSQKQKGANPPPWCFCQQCERSAANKSFSSALQRAARSAVTPTNPGYIKVVIPQLKF